MDEIVGYIQFTAGTSEKALTYVPVDWSPENPNKHLHDNELHGHTIPGPGTIFRTSEGLIYQSKKKPPQIIFLAPVS